MSELELLFLVLAVIYGWECTCWLRHEAVGFRTWLGRCWRMARPSALLGNQHGGFIFSHPLPPLGSLLTSSPPPLTLSARFVRIDNVSARQRDGAARDTFNYEELARVESAGSNVRLKGELLAKASSPIAAQALVEELRRLAGLPPAQRANAVEDLVQARLDTKAAKHRWEEFQRRTAGLRLLTNGLFCYLFILAPLLIHSFGLRTCWLGLVAGLLGFTVSTAVLFGRAHKALYPQAEDERFTHFLIILLSPATTIRALDVLSRPLLQSFHPLALAKLFCDEASFLELARRSLREARHPAGGDGLAGDVQAKADGLQGRPVERKALERFLRKNGLEPEDLVRAPEPADHTCRAYCPRCLAQFTSTEGQCDDCGGVRLVALGRISEVQRPPVSP